ncbi:TonB-dependent receptor [Neptunicella marina]|uniref:TonB-dependent receptor n=1 Tax=Neptunicella marina TaxID=2125989 RepID=A0A8J6IUF4_9ALTE|nr:TonB-dependent receptor [Neptunicella marina]MBC3765658.1 TonB-dependent receptor [Neptunicella marina]
MAQEASGSIRGSVSAAGASAISNASISITNKDTGVTRSILAKNDGSFRIPRLALGTYSLTAQKEGYQTVKLDNVTVKIGNATTVDVTLTAGDVEVISVSGARISMIDTTSTESALNISAIELERIPVERSLNSVALLAPGVGGGGRHGGVSFGGSSSAENAVFINGLNVTDPQFPTGFSSVPFSFYKDFQVKTGGYSAEFGRTTGGVLNAAVKSGSNEFDFGADVYYTPGALKAKGRVAYDNQGRKTIDRTVSQAGNDSTTASIYASGAIIKDKLFFFALYEPRLYQNEYSGSSEKVSSEANNGFWGGKIDYYLTENHRFEFIAFSDEDETVTETINLNDGSLIGSETSNTGGKNYITTYTGYLTDSLTVKAMYGELRRKDSSNDASTLECNKVQDGTKLGPIWNIGCTTSTYAEDKTNGRDAYRLDAEWQLDDHLLRFGMDYEERFTEQNRTYSGPTATQYTIYDVSPGDSLNGEVQSADYDYYVFARTRKNIGNYKTKTSAYYVEDIWSMTDTMTLTLGARLDEFDTDDVGGVSFLNVEKMISPRIGYSWDINGDGESKFFANLGRYYYPIPNSLVVNEGGGTVEAANYFYLQGGQLVDGEWVGGFTEEQTASGFTNLIPNLGPQIGSNVELASSPEPGADQSYRIDQDIDASYQDELILGYETMLNEDWRFGSRMTYRKFQDAIEDMKVYHDWGDCDSPGTWLIGNPGKEITLNLNCNGTQQLVTLDLGKTQIDADHSKNKTGKDIGSPTPFRKYLGLDFVLEKQWRDDWSLYASYTWAHSWGNYEGGLNSDTSNNVAGWLEYGDDPMYLVGGYGNLPNDRRHTFKIRGAYAVDENWTVSGSFSATSGAPINVRGVGNPYTTDEHYYMNWICAENCSGEYDAADRVYNAIPRGSWDRYDWLVNLNAKISYKTSFAGYDTRFALDVFNLLNNQAVTRIDHFLTQTDSVGAENPGFGEIKSIQATRSMRLSASVRF